MSSTPWAAFHPVQRSIGIPETPPGSGLGLFFLFQQSSL